MSDFVVSARKYRPNRFVDVVGQEHITETLQNSILSDKLAHAFLFTGSRGIGKTTTARILAKSINCTNRGDDAEPCNECESCTSFDSYSSFNIMELDAASNNSVENIRTLIDQVRIPPQSGQYRVFIIDEVHMLSSAAFNAFLKTLEEPPSYAIFILATTEKHKILPTILSRCQIFDFKRISVPEIISQLEKIAKEEALQTEKEALYVIARHADGALRDALSIFDRMISFGKDKVTYQDTIEVLNELDHEVYFQLMEYLQAEQADQALLLFNKVTQDGFEGSVFLLGLLGHIRDLLMCQYKTTSHLVDKSEEVKKRYNEVATSSSRDFLLTLMDIAHEAELSYRMADNKTLHVELALLKMSYFNKAVEIASLEKKNLVLT